MTQEDLNEMLWKTTPLWRKRQIAEQNENSEYIQSFEKKIKELTHTILRQKIKITKKLKEK